MKKSLLIFLVVFSSFTYSQVNDAGMWLSCAFQKNLKGKFTAFLNPVIRLNENITEVGSAFLDGGLEYKLNKRFRISLNYRFTGRRRLDDTYSFRNRFYADFTSRTKVKKITFSHRLRIQSQLNDYFTSRNGVIPSYSIRNRAQIKYDINKKNTASLSAELWLSPISQLLYSTNMRYVGGWEHELNKRSSVTLSYIFQRELSAVNPVTDYIVSLSFSHSF